MSDQVKKSGENIQPKGRLYYALRIIGIIFKFFLVGLAELWAASSKSDKELEEEYAEEQERELRNQEKRRSMGCSPYVPSIYDE